MIEMIAAYRKRVAVTAKHEHMQVGTAERHAAGEWQGAAVDVMHTVRLDKIREAAGATDPGDGRNLLVPQLALFDEFEVKSQYGEIAAARTPGRVVRGEFFLAHGLAFRVRQRWDGSDVSSAAIWDFNGW